MPRGIKGSSTHGGSGSLYANGGCRCAECTAANTARLMRRKHEREALTRAGQLPEGVPHGAASTYENWGCRCPSCTAAHRVAWNAGRKRAEARGRPWASTIGRSA